MSTYVTPISRGGQITLAADVRRFLGVQLGDRVVVSIVDGEVKVAPVAFTAAQLSGSVPMRNIGGLDYEDAIDEAIEDHVEEFLEKYNRR